jgi:hypothetical protein
MLAMDPRGCLADGAGQHRRLLQRETLGNPHRAQPDAFGFQRLVDPAARIVHPAGEDVGAELVKQRLRAWLLGHGWIPCAMIAIVLLCEVCRLQLTCPKAGSWRKSCEADCHPRRSP